MLIISGCSKISESPKSISKNDVNSETEFQLNDIDGNIVNIADYRGKPLVLKFWASWCPICLASLDETEELSSDKNKNFELVTVVSPDYKNEKSEDDFTEWFKTLGADESTVLLDNEGELAKKLSIRVVPTFVYYDEDGEFVKIVPGQADKETIQKNINEL